MRENERTGPGRRWWALVVIGLAQLMVVLDATVVNIALPSAQRELGMTDASRSWVITAYSLAFGGLLLLGGRVCDLLGHKRTFLGGLAGFAVASVVGGMAFAPGVLFGARALQGMFAAALAPAALSLVSTTFPEARERARAFGVFGALSSGGAAAGLLAGGLLTEYLGWRWCLYVNVPIATVALLGAVFLVRGPARQGGVRLDVPGALLSGGGIAAVVYGLSEVESHGWTHPVVLGTVAGGVLLLAGFVAVQARVRGPLLPLRVVLHRGRGGAVLAVALSQLALFGFFLFMTYYLQTVLGYSPVRAGLSFLPMTAAMVLGASVLGAGLLPRVGARGLMVPGLLAAAAGLGMLTQLDAGGPDAYLTLVLPAQLLVGTGIGAVMMPAMSTATAGVRTDDAGIASAMVDAAQQLGGSLGTALLNTIATTATAAYLASGVPRADGVVHGYAVALSVAAAILLGTAVVTALLLRSSTGRAAPRSPAASGAR